MIFFTDTLGRIVDASKSTARRRSNKSHTDQGHLHQTNCSGLVRLTPLAQRVDRDSNLRLKSRGGSRSVVALFDAVSVVDARQRCHSRVSDQPRFEMLVAVQITTCWKLFCKCGSRMHTPHEVSSSPLIRNLRLVVSLPTGCQDLEFLRIYPLCQVCGLRSNG